MLVISELPGRRSSCYLNTDRRQAIRLELNNRYTATDPTVTILDISSQQGRNRTVMYFHSIEIHVHDHPVNPVVILLEFIEREFVTDNQKNNKRRADSNGQACQIQQGEIFSVREMAKCRPEIVPDHLLKTLKFISLIPQTIHRIGQCGFNGLRTDGCQCNNYGQQAGYGKHPPLNFDTVGKILQPSVHAPPGDGRGDDKGYEDEPEVFGGKHAGNSRNGSANDFTDTDLFFALIGSENS